MMVAGLPCLTLEDIYSSVRGLSTSTDRTQTGDRSGLDMSWSRGIGNSLLLHRVAVGLRVSSRWLKNSRLKAARDSCDGTLVLAAGLANGRR